MDDFEDDFESTTHGTDDDLSLPKATITKLISEMLPSEIVCDKDARDLLVDCCTEFVHLIASEANDICEKTTKKTINGEHIVTALKNLGFQQYVDEIRHEIGDHKEQQQKVRGAKKEKKLAQRALSDEELIRQQEDLFKAAREKYQQRLMEEQQEKTATTEEPKAES